MSDVGTPATDRAASGVTAAGESRTTAQLRRGVLAIAALVVVGTTIELVSIGHWKEKSQVIGWLALVVLAVAIGLVLRASTPRTLQLARLLAVGVCGAAAIGVVAHVHGNYEAGPLDAVYGDKWETMSELSRWWAALTKAVGPSPALAPGILVIGSLLVLLATVGHPALAAEAAET